MVVNLPPDFDPLAYSQEYSVYGKHIVWNQHKLKFVIRNKPSWLLGSMDLPCSLLHWLTE
jgi:hypothetical protein